MSVRLVTKNKAEPLIESLRGHSRIAVLGNSGSLLDLPPQDQWPEDMLVIGTNRILRVAQDGRQYRPDAIVISDGRAYETERKAFYDYSGVLFLSQWIGSSLPHVEFISRPSRRQHYRVDIKRWPTSLEDRLYHWNNVCAHACQIAYFLLEPGGTVYLAGAENTWPNPGDPRRTKHHFYSDSVLPKPLRPFGVNFRLARQWNAMSRWFERGGKRLVDTSPWRDLALPNMNWEPFPCR